MSAKLHAAQRCARQSGSADRLARQRNDIAFAHGLIDSFAADATIGDNGYDADHLCERIAETGSEVVIPPKRNRTVRRPYDVALRRADSCTRLVVGKAITLTFQRPSVGRASFSLTAKSDVKSDAGPCDLSELNKWTVWQFARF